MRHQHLTVPLDVELILPEQFRVSADRSPEKRLMAALLENALDDLMKARTHDAGRPLPRRWGPQNGSRREMQRALCPREYFLLNDHEWPLSFVNICDTLELDPEAIRACLRRKGLL